MKGEEERGRKKRRNTFGLYSSVLSSMPDPFIYSFQEWKERVRGGGGLGGGEERRNKM